MIYLSIPFSFSACNLRHNEYVTGMPALTAVAGMAIHAERVLTGYSMPSLKVEGFSWVLFSLDRDQYAPRRPAQEVRKGQATLPALMDIQRGHGEAALILAISTEQDCDYTTLCQLLLAQPSTLNALLEAELSLAGACVFLGLDGEFKTSPLMVGLYERLGDVFKAYLRSYPTKGLLIQDMSQYLSEQAGLHGKSTLDSLLDCLWLSQQQRSPQSFSAQRAAKAVEQPVKEQDSAIHAPEQDDLNDVWGNFFNEEIGSLLCDDPVTTDSETKVDDQDSELINEYLGILLPTAVGYHEICTGPESRLIVESVISLVRARILASAVKELKEQPEAWQKQCWTWQHLPQYGLFRALSLFNKNEADHG